MAKEGWREYAIEFIQKELTLLHVWNSAYDLSNIPVTRSYIDSRYPFIIRSSFPHKVWIQELNMMEVFLSQTEFKVEDYIFWRKKQFKRKPKYIKKAPGQLKIPNLSSK